MPVTCRRESSLLYFLFRIPAGVLQSESCAEKWLAKATRPANKPAELSRLQRHSRSISQLLALLSPREREVLELLIDGLSSREIGDELGISKKTVDVHRGHIREKLGIGSVAGLVRLVVHNPHGDSR